MTGFFLLCLLICWFFEWEPKDAPKVYTKAEYDALVAQAEQARKPPEPPELLTEKPLFDWSQFG